MRREDFIYPGEVVLVRWAGSQLGKIARVTKCYAWPEHCYALTYLSEKAAANGIPRAWLTRESDL